jgi:hypothetical protein
LKNIEPPAKRGIFAEVLTVSRQNAATRDVFSATKMHFLTIVLQNFSLSKAFLSVWNRGLKKQSSVLYS